jgi:hypothetical protein
MEYLEKFNQLCQYAAECVWNDEEKKCCFVRGLYSKIQRMLVTVMDDSYDKIVSIAIAVDDANQADLEDKKRKRMQEESLCSNFRCLKIVCQPVHHSLYLPPQQQAQQQVIVRPSAVSTYPSQPDTPSVRNRTPQNH